jgi:hypothetical protein
VSNVDDLLNVGRKIDMPKIPLFINTRDVLKKGEKKDEKRKRELQNLSSFI